MSQDEQETQEVETTTPPAPEETNTQEDNANDADETAKAPASGDESNEIDYEAELAKAKKRLGQAEFTIQKLKGQGKKPAEVVDEAIEETPGEITVDQFEKKLETKFKQELQTFKMEQTRDLVDAGLESLTDNPKERELIKFHYENSLNHSGYTRSAIKADLENAKLLANRSKILAENRELKESLKAKGSISNSGRGSNQDKIVAEDEPKFTPAEMAVIERQAEQAGLSVKEYIRRNKSTLTE